MEAYNDAMYSEKWLWMYINIYIEELQNRPVYIYTTSYFSLDFTMHKQVCICGQVEQSTGCTHNFDNCSAGNC